MYEGLAKEAADAFARDQTDPNVTIARLAAVRGFNPDQIHRVAELANHEINATMAKSASDQLFTFPVATVRGVMDVLATQAPVATGVLEPGVEIDNGIYGALDSIPDFTKVLESRRFRQKQASLKQEKTADAHDEPQASEWSRVPEDVRFRRAAGVVKTAEADAEYRATEVRVKLAAVRQAWESLSDSGDDRLEFCYGAAAVLGIPEAQKLAAVLGDDAKELAAGLDAQYLALIVPQLDTETPIVRSFAGLRDAVQEFGAAQKTAATVREQFEASDLWRRNRKTAFVDKALNSVLRHPVRRAAAAGALGYAAGGKPLGVQLARSQLTPDFGRAGQAVGAIGKTIQELT